MLTVQDLMSTLLETASPDEDVNAVFKRMLIKGIHHMPVIDNGRLAGLLSIRDLDTLGNEADREGLRVSAAMITQPTTVPPVMPVPQAAELMRSQTLGCLPVMKDGRLIGIVTTHDMLALIAKQAEQFLF